MLPPKTVWIIVLAAGGSTRLGRPKQLLFYKDGTFLSLAVREATNSKAQKVVVVLGPWEDECLDQIQQFHPLIIANPNWQQGMSTSIREGLHVCSANPSVDALIVTACDQPFVTSAHLDRLIDCFSEGKNALVATSYGQSYGIPALFSKKFFDQLKSLDGDSGAKSILRNNESDLALISLLEAKHDVDTEADYQEILALERIEE